MFGDNLKELRILSNLTQQDLAKRLNLSQETISFYESGKREPDYTTLKKIADFFNVSIDYLFGRANVEQNIHVKYVKKENLVANKILKKIDDFSFKNEKELRNLLENAKNLTPEQLELLSKFLKSLK